ncbi:MAG: hypothetical protein RID91_20260 [Azospirillaceae bacterium]
MKIEAKVSKGHLIRCDCGESFLVRSLGIGVECPKCGATALSTELASVFYEEQARFADAGD